MINSLSVLNSHFPTYKYEVHGDKPHVNLPDYGKNIAVNWHIKNTKTGDVFAVFGGPAGKAIAEYVCHTINTRGIEGILQPNTICNVPNSIIKKDIVYIYDNLDRYNNHIGCRDKIKEDDVDNAVLASDSNEIQRILSKIVNVLQR